jgi:all-beta uncharacterized protein
VNLSSSCQNYSNWFWSVSGASPWITGNANGPAPDTNLNGDQTVRYNVAPNTGAARTGEITINVRFPGITYVGRYSISQQTP